MSDEDEKFWLDSPSDLLTNLSLFPTESMKKEARLNAITRLIILISILLYLIKSEHWMTVLFAGLGMVLIIYKFNLRQFKGFKDNLEYFNKPVNFEVERESRYRTFPRYMDYDYNRSVTTGFRINSATTFRKK